MNGELIEALRQIQREKNINPEAILEGLENALLQAYMKNNPDQEHVRVVINRQSGTITVFADALDEEGNIVSSKDVTPKNFGRIAAQMAKQVIVQTIREAERDSMYDEYVDRVGDIMTGIVEQSDQRYTLINFGRVEALLPPVEQVSGERYDHGSRIKVLILEVKKTGKGAQIIVSRTHPGLLKRLFELEVPEIYDGFVEIKSVAREAGHRSKLAVSAREENIDPVGACVGPKGSRVRMVVNELRGEKIDVVEWSDDPKTYVANALSPAKVSEVLINEDTKRAVVVVPDTQLSLAIGKEGQNARLAAKMTGWKIDIKSESQYAGEQENVTGEMTPVEEGGAPSGATEGSADVSNEVADDKRCHAIKSSGERCANKAKPGSLYCGLPAHQRLESQ